MSSSKFSAFIFILLLTACICKQAIGQGNEADAEKVSPEKRQQIVNAVREMEARMTGFYRDPSQQKMDELTKVFRDNSQYVTARSPRGMLGSIVMGLASKKFDLKIKEQGPLFDTARAVANDDKSNELVKLLAENSDAGELRIKVWWYSYYATGETKYLEQIQNLTGDIFADNFEGQQRLSMIANGDLMRVAYTDDKVAEFCQSAAKKEKNPWRKSLLESSVAWNKFYPENYEGFDRKTPEGVLRLFALGMLTSNEDLIRLCIYPTDENKIKILTSGETQSLERAKDMVATMEYRPTKAGDQWTKVSGEKVDIADTDPSRGVYAFLGPKQKGAPPILTMKIYGEWWVYPDPIIDVREAAKRLREKGQ